MTKKKRGLGRGLDALLSASNPASVSVDNMAASKEVELDPVAAESADGLLIQLPLGAIRPGQYQPRKDIQPEALDELAESIKAQGLMQPIVVRLVPGSDKQYEIIAGERRWRASEIAGLTVIPALVRRVSDESAMAMALIENIQRENLNPMEEAEALYRLQEEFELTQQEIARVIGRNRTTVANLLRLMKLNPDVKRLLENGDLEMGHARALLGLEGDVQSSAAMKVVADSMTVRQAEALVRQQLQPKVGKAGLEKSGSDPDVMRLERLLGDKLGAKVSIQHNAQGKGKLVVNYSNLNELDGILDHIK